MSNPEEAPLPSTDILQLIIPRLFKTNPFASPVLCLEVIGGPYRGVIFSFSQFNIMPGAMLSNGMVPVRFETVIYKHPENFTKDEAFDTFSTEVVLAWLHYINVNNLSPLLQAAPPNDYVL